MVATDNTFEDCDSFSRTYDVGKIDIRKLFKNDHALCVWLNWLHWFSSDTEGFCNQTILIICRTKSQNCLDVLQYSSP